MCFEYCCVLTNWPACTKSL